MLTLYSEIVINGMSLSSRVIPHIDPYFGTTSSKGEAVDLLISQPELPLQVPKPIFVFLPISIEVFLSISPPLEHDPLSIAHVTVDLEGLHTSRVNSVDSILSASSLIDLLTVTRYGVSRVTCSNDQNPSSSDQCVRIYT